MKTLLVVEGKDAVLFEGVKSLAEEWVKNGVLHSLLPTRNAKSWMFIMGSSWFSKRSQD
jgi:hypothetical protein